MTTVLPKGYLLPGDAPPAGYSLSEDAAPKGYSLPEALPEAPEGYSSVTAGATWPEVAAAIPMTTVGGLQKFVGGATQAVGDLLRSDTLSEAGAGIAESGQINLREARPKGEMSFAQESALSGVPGAIQQIPTIALTVASGGVAPAMLGAAALTGGTRYGELREAGFGGARSGLHAGVDAAVEAALELWPAKFLAGIRGKGFARAVLGLYAREVPTELLTTALQDANAKMADRPNMTMEEFAKDLGLTLGATIVSSPLLAGAAKLTAKAVPAREPETTPELIVPPELPSPEAVALAGLDPNLRQVLPPDERLRQTLLEDLQEAARLASEVQAAGVQPVLVAKQLFDAGELSMEKFAAFRRALVKQEAAATRLHVEELRASGQEAKALEQSLREVADEEYVPTQAELEETRLADQLVAAMGVPGTPKLDFLNSLPRTWLGRMTRLVASTEQLYERIDRQSVTDAPEGSSLQWAQYYRVLAERQAGGIYPFAATGAYGYRDRVSTAGIRWKEVTGNEIQEQTPGAVLVGDSAEQTVQLANTLQKWVSALSPDAKLRVVGAESWGLFDPGATNRGWIGAHYPISKGEGVVAIDTQRGAEIQVETLAHEYGHFLGRDLEDKLPPFISRALRKAWGKATRQRLDLPVEQMQERMRGPFGYIEPLPDNWTAREALQSSPFMRGYLFSYEEWKAHQMERMLASNRLGMGDAVDSYFKRYKEKLKQLFNKFHDDFAPNKTFEEFIRLGALRERQKVMEQARFDEASTALRQYGFENFSPEELTDLKNFLAKSLAVVEAPQALKDAMQQAPPDVQQRAKQAMERIGLAETALMTPQQGGDAESYTTTLEDAYLPGQPNDVPQQLLAGRPLPKASLASRAGSFLRNSLRYSSLYQRYVAKDISQYEGHLDRFGWYRKLAFGLQEIAKINPHIESLQQYVARAREWNLDRMNWIARADDRLRKWQDLNTDEQEVLGRFLLEQTFQGKFFDLQDPATQKQYPLTPRTLEMYEGIKEDFESFLSAIEATLQQSAVQKLAKNPFAAAAEMARIKARFAEYRKRPYFPLARFGQYLVVVRATRHIRVHGQLYKPGEVMALEAFQTDWERKMELDRIKGMYPTGDPKLDHVNEDVAALMGLPQPILEALRSDPNIALTDDQRRALDEYMYKIAPGHSWSKHLIRRRNVEGYTADVMRAYADYFLHGANHLARIKHSVPLAEAIRATAASADAIATDATKRRLIANYMRQHFKFIMHPQNDLAGLRGAIAVLYLGANPKSALVNLVQVPAVTYPHLAAKYGDVAALRAIKNAYELSYAAYKVARPLTKAEEAAVTKWAQGETLTAEEDKIVERWSKLSTGQRQMLRRGFLEGWLTESQATELAAISEGAWLSRFKTTSKIGYAGRAMAHYAMVPFQMAEQLNRRVTALAAFDLAIEAGATVDQAYEQARETTRVTQLEYAKWDRPLLLRGRRGIFFMFMRYQLGMLHFAFGGDPGWWRWWLMMLAIAGPMGLPFAENLRDLATWVATRVSGKRVDAKYEMRKAAEEMSKYLLVDPDVLLHGASRHGFGLLPFDLSGSLGMGRVLPGTDLLASPGGSFEGQVTRALSEAGGATSGLVMRMIQAMEPDPDLWRRIERGMPATAAQNLMQATRLYRRGAAENLAGADLTKFDTNDPWQLAEIVGKALGFQPYSIAEGRPGQIGREELQMRQDFANYYRIRREMLLRKLDHELEHGNRESVTEVREAIQRFNKSIPSRALGITNEHILRMRRARERGRTAQEAGLAPQRMYRDIERQVGERTY